MRGREARKVWLPKGVPLTTDPLGALKLTALRLAPAIDSSNLEHADTQAA